VGQRDKVEQCGMLPCADQSKKSKSRDGMCTEGEDPGLVRWESVTSTLIYPTRVPTRQGSLFGSVSLVGALAAARPLDWDSSHAELSAVQETKASMREIMMARAPSSGQVFSLPSFQKRRRPKLPRILWDIS
jgi:hypothetical protein